MRLPSARRSRKSGSVLILFTLMLPTLLIPLAGLAIDASVTRLVQLRLQAAVDGAALGAGRLLGTPAIPATLALEFLKANFRTDQSAGTWGAYNLVSNIVYTPGITKRIDINATARVPTLFMRIFGFSSASVSAAGSATRSDSRVVFVLDRSGSMTGDDGSGTGTTVLTRAKNYAASFVQKFTSGADQLGLVVYDGSAVVAYPALNPNWDPTTTSASTGGPDGAFNNAANPNNMVNQILAVQANNGQTGTADALWLAYTELQKTHLKDLAADGFDYRLNSIVLLTDGMPQSVSIWPNNPADNTPSVLKTAVGGCVNKITAINPNPTPMRGWIAVSRPFASQPPLGLYQLASRDITAGHTSVWWVGQGRGDEEALLPATAVGCTGLRPIPGNLGNAGATDFNRIPAHDAYGNSTEGTAYMANSQFINAAGTVVANPLPVGTVFNRTQVTSGNHWALAFWNATDDAARRIRADVNMPNRLPADTQNMKVAIYVIGYSGNAPGNDQGLLKRVANDTSSSDYNPAQATGLYVQAGNNAALANAFNTIYSAILRLAR